MVTIRELSKQSGYSISMISRVLNNYPYVDEDKRQTILKLINELDYRPNSIARNLSRGETKNIGVIVPFVNKPYFELLINGITKSAFEKHYKVTLLPTDYDKQVEIKYMDEFSAKSYDGIIITSKANDLNTLLNYQQYGPIVFCEYISNPDVVCAYIDRESALDETFTYFKQQHIQKIGITVGRSEKISPSSGIQIDFAKRHFKNFTKRAVVHNCIDVDDGLRAGHYFDKVEKVDGILANGDQVAAGIIEYFKNKKMPLIVGQDNLLAGRILQIPTIDYHLCRCGREAFDLFYYGEQKKKKINHTFIIR